jgi:septal ring factor EnvC (AmiA/AmiB activator)
VLSTTKQRYIEYYFLHKEGNTLEQIGEKYGCTIRTVERGLAWCRKQRVGSRELARELEDRIADLNDDIRRIERQIKRTERRIDNAPALGPKDSPLVGLTQAVGKLYTELREQKRYLAELEGIYKQTVNVNIGGQEGNELRLTIQRGGDGES